MSHSSVHSPELETRPSEEGEVCHTPTSRLSRPSSVSDLVLERLGNLTGIMERQNEGQSDLMRNQTELIHNQSEFMRNQSDLMRSQSEVLRGQADMNERLESLADRVDRMEGSPLGKFAVGSDSNPGYGMAMAAFCPTAADIDHSALGLRGPPDDVRLHPEPLGYPGTVRRWERLSNKPRPDYTSLGGKTRTFPRFALGSNPMPNVDTRSLSPGVPQQHVLPASVDESALGAAISRRGDGVTKLNTYRFSM